VQQKPVTASSTAAVATIATATTTSGLQVGVTNQQHQRPVSLSAAGNMSPSQTSLQRASTAPAGGAPCNTRITGPQPVDVNMKCIYYLFSVFLRFRFLCGKITNKVKTQTNRKVYKYECTNL